MVFSIVVSILSSELHNVNLLSCPRVTNLSSVNSSRAFRATTKQPILWKRFSTAIEQRDNSGNDDGTCTKRTDYALKRRDSVAAGSLDQPGRGGLRVIRIVIDLHDCIGQGSKNQRRSYHLTGTCRRTVPRGFA